MNLKVTLRDNPGDDFVRTIDVTSAGDFSKVERAAAAWAKQQVRGMPLYGHDVKRTLTMHLAWVDSGPPTRLVAQQSVTIKLPRKKGKKR